MARSLIVRLCRRPGRDPTPRTTAVLRVPPHASKTRGIWSDGDCHIESRPLQL